MLSLSGLFAVLVAASLGIQPAAATSQAGQAPSHSPACADALAALARGEPDKAREKYLDVLASDGAATCAVGGLQTITRAKRAEEKLCAESKCAGKGLGSVTKSEKEKGDEKSGLEKASDGAVNILKLLGSVAVAFLVLIGLVLMVILMLRRRKASLTIEAFADGAVEPKVGSTVAALVEKTLTDLSRSGRRTDDSYVLDAVVADVELMATNKSLETALGGLAEASQFTLVVAVLGLVDRMYGTHLVAKGELAPKGANGHGVMVALQSEKEGLQARGALWKASRAGNKNPTPYYELAEPTAAWIQYETARSLDSRVGLITTNAKSFSLLSLGLAEHRAGRLTAAAEKYAEALTVDPENVAAMFNLSVILARNWRWFPKGILLLVRAMEILQSRYEELE